MRRCLSAAIVALVVGLCPSLAVSAPITIDFETITEFDPVGTPFPGITFSNATVLMAGSGLNDLDFPPHSGTNAAFDDGGPMTIAFATPVFGFSGFFTYTTPLILTAFNAGNAIVGSTASAFASNLGTDVGSTPNEFLQLTFAGGIAFLTIEGDAFGGSFVLDDATITTFDAATPVPEPATISLLAGGLAMLVQRHRRTAVDNRSRRD